MTQTLPDLALGQPRFQNAALQAIADAQGPIEAWRTAVAKGRTAAIATAAETQGHFAVALGLPSGRCFMATDRFAAHSICFTEGAQGLRFAERADELGEGRTEIDPQAIYDYLYFHMIPSPRTVWRGVRRLPPGHFVWHEGGETEVGNYWTPRFKAPGTAQFAPLAEEFRQLLRRSVARALDGSKPACFLSGGTDSSTVAGLIGEVAGRPAASYSIGFDAAGYDEMAFARIAARRFGTEHHEYYVTPDDLVRAIPLAATHLDQPFGNSSALPAYYCALEAKKDGVSRLLAGDGGDELFGGNARYAKQRVFGWYQQVPGALRRGLLEPALSPRATASVPLVKKARSYVEQARVPLPARSEMYNLLLRLGPQQILTPGFLARVETQEPLHQQQAVWDAADAPDELNRTLAFDWRYTLAENDLAKVRYSTSMAGVEVAYPLLDDELLSFSLRLPVDYKLRGLNLRWFFKEALRGFLPDEIIAKKKHGFGLPFGVWATRHEALRRLATDSLQGAVHRGLVQARFVDELLSTHLPAHPGYYGEMVWILMMLEQWLRQHAPDTRLG